MSNWVYAIGQAWLIKAMREHFGKTSLSNAWPSTLSESAPSVLMWISRNVDDFESQGKPNITDILTQPLLPTCRNDICLLGNTASTSMLDITGLISDHQSQSRGYSFPYSYTNVYPFHNLVNKIISIILSMHHVFQIVLSLFSYKPLPNMSLFIINQKWIKRFNIQIYCCNF